MAKKSTKAVARKPAATSTSAPGGGTARGKAAPRRAGTARGTGTHDANTRTARAGDTDVLGDEHAMPTAAETVDAPQRPGETKLSLLQREHETALATGQVQPHPTMAPRAATTAGDTGPVGHARQPLITVPSNARVGDGIKVRAKEIGYYGGRRRRPLDTFVVTPREGYPMERVKGDDGKDVLTRNGRPTFRRSKTKRLLSAEEQLGAWMEPVDAGTPERASTSADVLAKEANGSKSRASDGDTI